MWTCQAAVLDATGGLYVDNVNVTFSEGLDGIYHEYWGKWETWIHDRLLYIKEQQSKLSYHL